MSESADALSLEQLKAALCADGRALSTEQVQALMAMIASLGGVTRARAAVELLIDLQDAA